MDTNIVSSCLPVIDMILYAIIFILAAAAAVMAVKLALMRRSCDELAEAVAFRLMTETNTLVGISSGDRHMRRLASALNGQLAGLREDRRRYRRGDTELREAVTNISHDLRTPLTAISGYLELLEREDKSPDCERYIAMIHSRTEAMKSLTEELFRYSVIASVEDESVEVLSLNSVLEESLLSFYAVLQKRGITPEIHITEKKVERRLNRSALSRIFGNIISNAVKYSDGDLSVELDGEGSATFSNSARSMSAVDAGRLFDRFFTVENGRESTGLGLSIAKLLTERMGGKISAVYTDGRLYIRVSFKG